MLGDYLQVKEAFGKSWDYYVGVVDLSKRDIDLYPLLLPRCEDGSIGHFILITFATEMESLGGPLGGLSDSQMLVKYNPNADDENSALEKVVNKWNYIITDLGRHYDYILSEARYPEIYTSQIEAMMDYMKCIQPGLRI